jgi:hypothetical protein
MARRCSYVDIVYNEARKRLWLVSIPDDLERDEDESAIFVFENDAWVFAQPYLEERARSMESFERHAWVICRDGEVVTIHQGAGRDVDQIPDSGYTNGKKLGPPNEIRRIAGRLYVAGSCNQVYTQDAKGKWVHIDADIVEKGPFGPGSASLESIDGTAPDRLFAVGTGGMFRYDGRKWTKIPLLTNKKLNSVRCFGKNDVWAVGNNGVVVHGDGEKDWHVEVIEGNDDAPLYDIERYEGRIYIAAEVLWVQAKNGWELVKHGLPKAKTNFYVLGLGGGKLWAMGSHRVNSFDTKKWVAHPDPDNG